MKQDTRELIEALKYQFEWLREQRKKREADWKDVQRLVAPSVFNWDDPKDRTPKRPQRFTSRPTNFLKTLRSGITGYSISPNIAWQKLGFEHTEDTGRYGAKDWLEASEKALYAEFNRSNLYPQVSKFIENASTYGHAVMLIDEQLAENRLRFTCLPIAELYLDINEYDEVDTVFRRYTMTLKNAAAFFGEEHLPDARRQDLKDKKNWNIELTIIHAVYKRQAFENGSKAAWDKPYASVYVLEGEDHLLQESGYEEFPYAVFIWDPVNGTAYGESPAIHALDDIRLLNQIDEARIKVTQLSADPAYNVPDTLRDPPNVVPSGFNYFTKPGEIITPIQTGTNFPITLQVQQEIENRVKDWFHVDFFLALMHQSPSNMTATYVMELQGEKAAVLSDLVVNLNAALSRIIQRSFNILWRQGKIPPPPPSLSGSGAQLKVDFVGPLAQAQKKYHESAGIEVGINMISAVGNISPDTLDIIDFDQTLKNGLEGLGFPQIAIREDEDIESLRQQRAQQRAQMQQQQAQMQQQQALMGNYDKLNTPVQPGSAIEQMTRQMAGGGVGQ
jgi:hypothetical protein